MNQVHFGGEQVTYTRRFFGDNWLESLLMVFTLGIGWLIWFAIVAQRAQTPAKQILNVYIHDFKTGKRASTGQVWMREIVGKIVIGVVLVVALLILVRGVDQAEQAANLYTLIGGAFVFFNPSRRALWDFIGGTVVRYHPNGFKDTGEEDVAMTDSGNAERRLRELEILHAKGLLSSAEYDEKRREILAEI